MGELSLDDWDRDQPCAADGIVNCHRCKPKPFPTNVFVSTGWAAAFHITVDCEGLAGGQRKVERRGGSPAPVERIHREQAISKGYSPCSWCFPDAKGRV